MIECINNKIIDFIYRIFRKLSIDYNLGTKSNMYILYINNAWYSKTNENQNKYLENNNYCCFRYLSSVDWGIYENEDIPSAIRWYEYAY